MRKLQELFYKIGRIVNYVMLGIHALVVLINIILLIVDAVAGNYVVDNISAIITNIFFAGFALALIIVDRMFAEKALKAPIDNLTPVIILMVGGLFVAFWCHVAGGVFGIIAAAQEKNGNGEAKKEEPVEEAKEEKAE